MDNTLLNDTLADLTTSHLIGAFTHLDLVSPAKGSAVLSMAHETLALLNEFARHAVTCPNHPFDDSEDGRKEAAIVASLASLMVSEELRRIAVGQPLALIDELVLMGVINDGSRGGE